MLTFLDFETTGVAKEDRICSLGCLIVDDTKMQLFYDLVNEGKKIPPLASSINNITNEMIQSKPPLKKSKSFMQLVDACENGSLLVAHNLPFELEMLKNSEVEIEHKGIDTLRVCRHLIPDLESYTLNFLRYEMKLYKKEEALAKSLGIDAKCLVPHDAQSDVIITKLLYDELLLLATKEEMIDLTTRPVLLQKFEFGKYAGRYIEEIAMVDRGYLEWMLRSIEDLSEDMRYTLEYYL
ncbi:Exonuclease [hydrothermal vent metagenome]|uniref:Exonuclease n=1 Tax=hydrothermal vent metagenome TaxID=652676 RepID=A0A1W1BDF5_9ZZZZ